MRFSQSFLDEIRARLPVSDVVRRRVQLKKAGREWKGLSPFNPEKTPSFFVNDQKGAWFDFSSGKNGSIFDFLMLTEGVSFREAVERCAAMAGLALPVAGPDEERREAKKKTLYDVVELAAKFFEESLQARTGAKARGYLADRGLTPETQARFRIGYASAERFALKEYLGGKGVSNEDMVEAGLLVSGDDIPVPFDRFRERVMFPISDFKGRVVGFGGRALSEDVPAKYLNSPETPLFHKGWLLYNGSAARAATQKDAPLIVVEGYIDAIAMVAAGFEGAVAPLGTALTEDQLALLWRMQTEPILCFDGDKAGQRAVVPRRRACASAFEAGTKFAVCASPRRTRPGRSHSRQRRGGDARGAGFRKAAFGNAVAARDRKRADRHAGAARGAGGAARRSGAGDRRRDRAALLPRRPQGAALQIARASGDTVRPAHAVRQPVSAGAARVWRAWRRPPLPPAEDGAHAAQRPARRKLHRARKSCDGSGERGT